MSARTNKRSRARSKDEECASETECKRPRLTRSQTRAEQKKKAQKQKVDLRERYERVKAELEQQLIAAQDEFKSQTRVLNGAAPKATDSKTPLEYTWQWREHGAWKAYAANVAQQLETAFQQGSGTLNFSLAKRQYTVDFKRLQQINDKTHTQRTVRRVLRDQSLLENVSEHLTDVEATSDDFARVAQLFDKSSAQVTRVQSYMNFVRSGAFEARCRDIGARLDESCPKMAEDVLQVFHGTSAASLRSILMSGFNRDHTVRHVHGKGVYFSRSAREAVRFAGQKDSGQPVHVIVAKLCVGNVVVGQRGQSALSCGLKSNGLPSETLVDKVSNPQVLVASLDDQALPQFVVTLQP